MKDIKNLFYQNKQQFEGPNQKEIKKRYNEMCKNTVVNY